MFMYMNIRMYATHLAKVALCLGTIFFTMSIFKRLFRRKSSKDLKYQQWDDQAKTSLEDDSVREASSDLNESKSTPTSVSVAESSQSKQVVENNSDCSAHALGEISRINTSNTDIRTDATEEKQRLKQLSKNLNTSYKTLRKTSDKHKRRQTEIMSMQRELKELSRLIQIYEQRNHSMDNEISEKAVQMEALFSLITTQTEDEIRKKDPITLRKYKNLKSAQEADNLLQTIRSKQKALKDIEILTFKKKVSLSYNMEAKEQSNNPFSPLNRQRRSFDQIFRDLRAQVTITNPETEENESYNAEQKRFVENATAWFQTMTNTSEDNTTQARDTGLIFSEWPQLNLSALETDL